jgi:ABC-type dipeptide/oligopeptide/nickel transport system permease component
MKFRRTPMKLLITFLIAVTIGIVGASWLGVLIDQMTSPFTSLLVFFPLFFLAIFLAWKIAVKFTAPKTAS